MRRQTNMTDLDILQELDPSDQPTPRHGLSIGSMVLLVGVALTVVVFGFALVRQQQTQPTAGPAPDFTLTTFDGKPFTLSEHQGEVVIINFWASWCGPCRAEAPALESLWQRYQDQGVVFLGITYADDPKDSQDFMAQYGMTYPNADDGKSEVSKALYHIQGVPETFVIDKTGSIRRFFYSVSKDSTPVPGVVATSVPAEDSLGITQSQLAELIDSLLKES